MFQLLLYLLKLLAILVFGAGTIVMLRSAIVHKRNQKDSKVYIALTVIFAGITVFIWNYDLAGCEDSEETEKEKVIAETKLMLRNYCEDVRKEGLLAEFKYLDNSKDFYWTPPGFYGAITFDSVASILRINASKYKKIINSFDSLNITISGKDTAMYFGIIDSRTTDSSGHETHVKLQETGSLVKRADGWKLLNGKTLVIN